MTDFDTFDPRAMLEKIRAKAAAAGSDPIADEDWRDIRRERVRLLDLDPDHVRLATAQQRCPVMPGHPGSLAAARAAESFVRGDGRRLLVLGGPTGRGKSCAATWVAACLDGSWWLSAKEVRVGEHWSNAAYPRALKALVLVVDDLGHESSEWASKELASLIEVRTDRGRRTVVTTNLPPEGEGRTLAGVYGDRLRSRLGSVYGSYVACGGDDLRRRRP